MNKNLQLIIMHYYCVKIIGIGMNNLIVGLVMLGNNKYYILNVVVILEKQKECETNLVST